ncbi:hypothetical protein, conserved [Leishmania tarentolae]|uniref:DUF7883 domain-containing protein n=1 Tax=Leishmania tarentolae TaxID=5689 RepID=A0A640KGR3_LEITA|nr:hypothetical protein, conserved [Leishmania tarentolae]
MRPVRTGALRSLACHYITLTSNDAIPTTTRDVVVGRAGRILGSLRLSTAGMPAMAPTRHPRALLLGCSTAQLRCSCHGEPLWMSYRFKCVKRASVDPTVDDQFITYLRSLLRSTGPMPISKLASMMDDENLERLGDTGGGLVQFFRRHPQTFAEVQLPGRVHVAMLSDAACPFRSSEHRTLGLRVIGLLTIAQHMTGTQVATSLGFSSSSPTVTELCKALRHWSLLSPIQLKRFLNQYDDVFWYHPLSLYVRLRSVKPCATTPTLSQSLPSPHALTSSHNTRFQLWLSRVLPSQYHVPVSYLMDAAATTKMSESLFGSEAPSLENMRQAFQQLPPKLVDVRAFGASPMAVFVRLLRPEPLLLQAGVRSYTLDAPPPESAASHHDPTLLGRRLTEALQKGAAADRLKHARLVKGLHMTHLRECVPADLVHEVEMFYGLVEGGDLRVSVLLLDRLRHMWEVQLDSCRVRPWAFLPESEQPSSLTLETSPVPRVMVHLQRIMADNGPQLPADLYEALPSDLQEALLRTYGPMKEADTSSNATTSPALPSSPETRVGAEVVSSFIQTHSLFFMKQGDHIYTPRLAAEELRQPTKADAAPLGERRRGEGACVEMPRGSASSVSRPANQGVEMSEVEVAQFLHDAIPVGQQIVVDGLRAALQREQRRRGLSGEKVRRLVRRDFFERNKRFFKLYEYFAYDKVVVGRAEDPPPPPNKLQPRITNIGQVIKFIALFSSQSASDGALTRALPREGRMILKTVGSVTDLAEQLPTWFVAQRDKNNFSSSLIRYIGPLAESEQPSAWALKPAPKGVLRRKVPNDPFADIGSEDLNGKPAGWNDEWNEDELDDDKTQAAGE